MEPLHSVETPDAIAVLEVLLSQCERRAGLAQEVLDKICEKSTGNRP